MHCDVDVLHFRHRNSLKIEIGISKEIRQFGNQQPVNIPGQLKVFQNYYKQRNTLRLWFMMKKGINPILYLSYLFQIITRRKIHGPLNRSEFLKVLGPPLFHYTQKTNQFIHYYGWKTNCLIQKSRLKSFLMKSVGAEYSNK